MKELRLSISRIIVLVGVVVFFLFSYSYASYFSPRVTKLVFGNRSKINLTKQQIASAFSKVKKADKIFQKKRINLKDLEQIVNLYAKAFPILRKLCLNNQLKYRRKAKMACRYANKYLVLRAKLTQYLSHKNYTEWSVIYWVRGCLLGDKLSCKFYGNSIDFSSEIDCKLFGKKLDCFSSEAFKDETHTPIFDILYQYFPKKISCNYFYQNGIVSEHCGAFSLFYNAGNPQQFSIKSSFANSLDKQIVYLANKEGVSVSYGFDLVPALIKFIIPQIPSYLWISYGLHQLSKEKAYVVKVKLIAAAINNLINNADIVDLNIIIWSFIQQKLLQD